MIPRMRLLNLNEQIITYKQWMSITRSYAVYYI